LEYVYFRDSENIDFMKILHISTSDKNGGAAIAAFRLHNAMLSTGINSKYLVLDRTLNDRIDILTISKYIYYTKKIVNILFEKITTKNMRTTNGLYSSFKYGIDISKTREVIEADVIYLHWINSFVNYHVLKKILKKGKLVLWFMHDMFPLTGGCHHSLECASYQEQCRKCPYHQGSALTDLSITQYRIKKKIYSKFQNIVFVAPSRWLFNCAKNSGLTKNKQIFHVPNLITTNIFRSINKNTARDLFLLSHNVKIIGFGADSALINPYKGWSYLKDALEILSKDEALQGINIEVLIFGSSYSEEIATKVPFSIHFTGRLYDEYSLAVTYNCMDVFVIPSLAENFPNTILESFVCNVPVVGFNVGGIPDMIDHKKNGYLAKYKSANDLAEGLKFVLLSKKYKSLCHEGYKKMDGLFNEKSILTQHFEIIKDTDRKNLL